MNARTLGLVLSVTLLACGSDRAPGPASSAPSSGALSASVGRPAATVSRPATSSGRASAALRTPSVEGVAALLQGGEILTSLPVRATDDGKSFDSGLPARLKPPPVTRVQPKNSSACRPGDPLCP